MTRTFLQAGAAFSPDRRYRLRLWRTWAFGRGTCVFCMLNPSTADAEALDPTVAKCVRYAETWGYGRLEVVNLFAFRGTNPDDLLPLFLPARIGDGNDAAILATCRPAACCVAAWGAHKAVGDRGLHVLRLPQNAGIEVHALHLAQGGAPGHPLYLKGTLQPRPIELHGTIVRWGAGMTVLPAVQS